VLVIEIDGKAVPTAHATKSWPGAESPRARGEQGCKCQRHRGRAKRKRGVERSGGRRGAKARTAASATLVVMDTLRRGEDGRLHGPITRRCSEPSARRSPRFKGRGPRRRARLSPRDRQDGADRQRRRDPSGAAAPPTIPQSDSDPGRAPRSREALGGRSAVPPGRRR